MSFSLKVNQIHIKTAVFFSQFKGLLQGGDLKSRKLNRDFLKAKLLINYFAQNYLVVTENIFQKEITIETPETVWQFWDNPAGRTTPEIVKSSLESVDRFKGNLDHRVLENATFEDYSDLPGYVLDKFKKGQIGYTHFSDLLRLNLLKNHGGIWLDATGYMTDFVPTYILEEDFFVFLTGHRTKFPYSFMQNCFIRAKKGSYLCDAWYQMCIEFWKNESKAIDYFQHQLIFKTLISHQLKAKKLFTKMPQISEDGSQQLVGDNLLKKFDAEEWEEIKKASFFQKTTYKVPFEIDYSGTYFSELCQGRI